MTTQFEIEFWIIYMETWKEREITCDFSKLLWALNFLVTYKKEKKLTHRWEKLFNNFFGKLRRIVSWKLNRCINVKTLWVELLRRKSMLMGFSQFLVRDFPLIWPKEPSRVEYGRWDWCSLLSMNAHICPKKSSRVKSKHRVVAQTFARSCLLLSFVYFDNRNSLQFRTVKITWRLPT